VTLRIVMPSIVDPASHRGGAGTTTRTLLTLLQRPPLAASVEAHAPAVASVARHRFRQVVSAARSLVSSLPAKAEFTRSRRLRRAVRRALGERETDLVLLNGADLLWLLPDLPPAVPRILVAHNIEHDLHLSRLGRLGPGARPLRRLLHRDWRRLRDYEVAGIRQIRNVIFLSGRDAELAGHLCGDLNAIVVPPLFDYAPGAWSRTRNPAGGLDLGFLANFGWWPNREGLRWFLAAVFPHLGDTTRLHLFGERSEQAAASHPRVVAHGFVPRLHDVWPACDLMICPILAGGGVSVKFAEIVYNGVPVVATSFTARGVGLVPHASIVLLDGADEWIAFLRSPAARELALRRGPAPAAAGFALETHVAPVQAFVSAVARRGGDAAAGR
jgi:hypothetical protein